MKRSDWSQCEGGTGAAPGRKGYTVRTALGQYSISPVSHKNGKHKGYRLVYFSQVGLNLKYANYPSGLCVDIGPDGSGIYFTASGALTLPECFKRAKLHEEKYGPPAKQAA